MKPWNLTWNLNRKPTEIYLSTFPSSVKFTQCNQTINQDFVAIAIKLPHVFSIRD